MKTNTTNSNAESMINARVFSIATPQINKIIDSMVLYHLEAQKSSKKTWSFRKS